MRALVQAVQIMLDGKILPHFRKVEIRTDGSGNRQHSRRRASKTWLLKPARTTRITTLSTWSLAPGDVRIPHHILGNLTA